MSHPRFEDWILNPEDRSPEEQRELQVHLAGCEPCRQLNAAVVRLDVVMGQLATAAPPQGFVDRWQRTLQADRKSQERRGAGLAFALAGGSALAVAISLGITLWEQVKAPAQIANQWLIALMDFLTQIRSAPTLLRIGLDIIEDVHPGWWLTMAATLGGLAVLWIYLLYRISFQQIPNGGSR
jgi:hypothetical protein